MRDPLSILGLPSQASKDEVKKKYRELAKLYHPDLVKSSAMSREVAEQKFRQITEAYKELTASQAD